MKPTDDEGTVDVPHERDETNVHGIPGLVADSDTGPLAGIELLCIAGEVLGQRFSVGDRPLVIGRAYHDVKLGGADVSRKHARIFRRDKRFWVEDLRSANGTYVNGSAITEVTELRFGDRLQVGSTILLFARSDELELRLRQLQRLDAMGALVKGLAHDFNNTLQVLHGVVAQLEDVSSPAEKQALLESANDALSSATGLVRRLLRLGRNKPETLELLDLDIIVRKSVAMAQHTLPASIRISAGDVSGRLRGSRNELEQAFLNVLTNARDAMSGGGEITVTAKLLELDRAAAHARHLSHAGRFVELAIRDEGCGMDAETISRAFEPFFTKKDEAGTGLGLTMVYSTVKNHGGTVAIESVVGLGTTVKITLPLLS